MKRDLKTVKKDFLTLARMTQEDLKTHLWGVLRRAGYDVMDGDGYLYGRGDHVLLTAHMDTVHAVPVKKVKTITYENDIIVSSPQGIGGDDRCGVWAILDVIPRLLLAGVRPAVLFCEDEEIGGVGSQKFCDTTYINELTALRYLIEIDRKGNNDAVYYDDDNTEFHKYVNRVTGYETASGSFSDISHLCPACGRSGVNLSSGYYNAHTPAEYVSIREMIHTADVVKKLVMDTVKKDVAPFEYVDKWENYSGGYPWYDDDITTVVFHYVREHGETSAVYEAYTLYEAIGQFMFDHPDMRWNDVLDYEIM